MKRGTALLENISKLNTYIHMTKSNEFLSIYIDKIINKKCKSIKFINEFDQISLDLLYTSLQIMNYKDKVTKDSYNKLDKKELKYYLDKVKGLNYFKNQAPSIKTEEILVDYIRESLSKGRYICNNNNTIKFDNGMIVDSDWLVDFTNFLTTSLNNNINLSNDGLTYYFKTVSIPNRDNNDVKKFIKNLRLYEYNVTRKDNNKLTYQDIKYLIDILSVIDEYDFKQLQDINSTLSKENYSLSVNKKNISFNKDDKQKLEKMLNEEHYERELNEFVKDALNCHNSRTQVNKRKLINTYEMLRSLSHAYKCNYNLDECRKLFSLKEHMEALTFALAMANFYINYIYDEEKIDRYFNYALLELDSLKPIAIDYETIEYKNIISELSSLNKKVVIVNRKINRCLDNARLIPKKNVDLLKENSKGLAHNCQELEKLVSEIQALRDELAKEKDGNREKNNINKTKLRYIKEAVITGKYTFDSDTSLIIFECFSPKDYHCTFRLEITLNEFIDILLSEHNRNLRINFYQIT